MRCAQCGRAGAATTLSTHLTSEGWVRYRRCACGAVSIEVVTFPAEPERVFPASPGTVTAGSGVAGASGMQTRDRHAARA